VRNADDRRTGIDVHRHHFPIEGEKEQLLAVSTSCLPVAGGIG
jgi:hypothetical protein